MIDVSKKKFSAVINVDRGRSETRNCFILIMNVINSGIYKLGTKKEKLVNIYTRICCICHEKFITVAEVPHSELSFRQCIKNFSYLVVNVIKNGIVKENAIEINVVEEIITNCAVVNVIRVYLVIIYKAKLILLINITSKY